MSNPKYFSTMQTRVGTFIGGPFAAVYFIRSNYLSAEKPGEAKHTLYIGLVVSILLFAVSPLIPEAIPAYLFSLVIAFLAGFLVQSLQISVYDHLHTDKFTYKSWLQVIGIGLAFLAATIALIFIIIFGLASIGINFNA